MRTRISVCLMGRIFKISSDVVKDQKKEDEYLHITFEKMKNRNELHVMRLTKQKTGSDLHLYKSFVHKFEQGLKDYGDHKRKRRETLKKYLTGVNYVVRLK